MESAKKNLEYDPDWQLSYYHVDFVVVIDLCIHGLP